MSDRDDFPAPVRRIVAQRAGYLCSCPDCRKLTIRPHSDPEKSLSNGVAAHIHAAAPNGPRYDPDQTPEGRSNIANAIWLCHDHSDIIDKDEKAYPAELLYEWKKKHDEYISNNGHFLELPHISIHTTEGLSIQPSRPTRITGNDVSHLREHILAIENTNRRDLSYLKARIQFPEYIVRVEESEVPIGTNIRCYPDRPSSVVNATGGGSVEMSIGDRPSMNYELEIDKLPALKTFRIKFLSVAHPSPDGYILGFSTESSMLYIHGELQHEYYGEQIRRRFVTKFQYDLENRRLSSEQCEEYTADTKLSIRCMI